MNKLQKTLKGIAVGDVLPTKSGDVTVMEIRDAHHIVVRFNEHPFDVVVQGGQLRLGNIKNRMKPLVHGKGFIGDGPYAAKFAGKITCAYISWRGMLERIYEPHLDFHFRNYSDVTICSEWHNFQNFAAWYYDFIRQYPNPNNVDFSWNVDKDFRIPGNRVYSPDACCVIPGPINSLLTDRELCRGEYPIGVIPQGSRFKACVSLDGRKQNLGTFDTPYEALAAYWEAKFKAVHHMTRIYWAYLPDDIRTRFLNFGWSDAIAYYGTETVFGLAKDAA